MGHTFDPARDFYKNHLENYRLPCPSSGLPGFADCLFGVLFPALCIFHDSLCTHRGSRSSFLFPTSVKDRLHPPLPMSASCLSRSQQLHFVPRGHSKCASPGRPLGTLLLLCSESGEEKMLTQAARREQNCCHRQVLGVLAASSGALQRPCVFLSLRYHT